MLHLELLHNFSTLTCYTLSHNAAVKDVMRIEAPRVAFGNDYAMHGLLAVSALHLSHLRSDKQQYYLSYANEQYELGLSLVTPLVQTLNPQNCSALYMFAVFSVVFSTAKPRNPHDFPLIGDGQSWDWFTNFRGMRALIEPSVDVLRKGPFGPMFQMGMQRSKLREQSTSECEQLLHLRQLVSEFCSEPKDLKIYSATIDELAKCYNVLYGPVTSQLFELSDVFIWLWRVPDEYLTLVRKKTPEALSILAYFAVMISRLGNWWWLDGLSGYLISTIWRELDSEYRSWIRWPIEEIGGLPE
jgi:hypothetical protein